MDYRYLPRNPLPTGWLAAAMIVVVVGVSGAVGGWVSDIERHAKGTTVYSSDDSDESFRTRLPSTRTRALPAPSPAVAAPAETSAAAEPPPVSTADPVPARTVRTGAECSGGTINFTASPVRLANSPIDATVTGNLVGCRNTPSATATVRGDFTGAGNCLDVAGRVDGTFTWANGEISTVVGPWRVPGGAGAPQTNTVVITRGPGTGKQLLIDQGPVDGRSQVGHCLTAAGRNISLPINGIHVS
ncbi:hypothetical protein [Nocardia arthritidis]|uniref:Uncharacterized protein n=1 Tax=Nocardia arthritidis TaxID=228602 RepID=A0A6G9YLF1_9NOCA|nr:hypothetical protein [Nocardia arthritidis]QIS14028.1 hypothetical protein F5544_30925 [Nocardia arthritidis]